MVLNYSNENVVCFYLYVFCQFHDNEAFTLKYEFFCHNILLPPLRVVFDGKKFSVKLIINVEQVQWWTIPSNFSN